jgi:cell division septum initiation protein DivIVA
MSVDVVESPGGAEPDPVPDPVPETGRRTVVTGNRVVPDLPGSPLHRPEPRGGLDIVESAPGFRTVVRGYDRLQVDNYVAWAETEVLVARRMVDDTSARWAACAAELLRLREELARRPQPEAPAVEPQEAVGELLRRVAEEAAELTAAAEDEAADLRERAQVAADAVLARAREEAERLLEQAAAERQRFDEEADRQLARDQEQARAELSVLCSRLVDAREETADLERRRDAAIRLLHAAAEQVGTALRVLEVEPPATPAVRDPAPG